MLETVSRIQQLDIYAVFGKKVNEHIDGMARRNLRSAKAVC